MFCPRFLSCDPYKNAPHDRHLEDGPQTNMNPGIQKIRPLALGWRRVSPARSYSAIAESFSTSLTPDLGETGGVPAHRPHVSQERERTLFQGLIFKETNPQNRVLCRKLSSKLVALQHLVFSTSSVYVIFIYTNDINMFLLAGVEFKH